MDNWDKWICAICEYLYDPVIGDPENGIESWTSFMELPAGWTCPSCGMGKEQFIPYPEYAQFDVSDDIET